MGQVRKHPPAMLILAAFSRHGTLLQWAREQAEGTWGAVALASDIFTFKETDYYAPTMGSPLQKVLLAFQRLADPADLAPNKLLTNQWEERCCQHFSVPEPRPLNLDPGYLTEAKLVLASTKDHAHRIYLSRGIFAEVTLQYQGHQWRPSQWTFPDYRRMEYLEFFTQCRRYLRKRLKEA